MSVNFYIYCSMKDCPLNYKKQERDRSTEEKREMCVWVGGGNETCYLAEMLEMQGSVGLFQPQSLHRHSILNCTSCQVDEALEETTG